MEDAKEVCPTTTQKLLKDGAILVDVRERDEIDALAFDVPSLIIMPMSELESRFAELPKDVPLILACRKGVRSLKATYFLMFHGYTNVTNMKFGIERWVVRGFPVKGDPGVLENAPDTGCCSG
ncbi:MAG: rhodanese-like domain-containing protein [Macellibacteroides fermentans]|uniref:rhodanese-like domain-containing protein n=1 Tax=Macellibacteroides fermentans TaxID=879969 RepID=UPI003B6DE844